ncbi:MULTISPECIES: DUF551 domain-containing protein [Bacteria]|uniref:DUF551 domain-containing protein n=1 Tax=Bacteria TaxID=2 RepID=UPI0036FD004D
MTPAPGRTADNARCGEEANELLRGLRRERDSWKDLAHDNAIAADCYGRENEALEANLIALARMYGEVCRDLVYARSSEDDLFWQKEEAVVALSRKLTAAEAEAASLRSQLQEAQKAGEGSGRDPGGSGSRPSDQAASHPAPAGFDPSRMQWQPIATAPKDGGLILLWSGIVMRAGWWFEDDEAWRVGGDTILRAPTHWMPLPSPPALGIEAAVPPEPKGPAEGESPTPQGGMPDLTPIPATEEAGDHEPR